jgi:hypothetical protein
MARRWWRFLVPSGLLLVLVVLVRRTVRLRDEELRVVPSRDPWTPITEVLERKSEPASAPAPAPRTWEDPVDGACPPGHPIKAKVASGIYHIPGTANYERTKPDRCYAEEAAAAADGFTKAKR